MAQTRGFVNSPLANTASVCFQALFACIGAAIPLNAGSLRLITISAPLGSLVNCRAPAPTTASTLLTCAAIAEAVWLALADAIPSQTQAGWGRRCAPMSAGFNPRTQRPFVCTHHNCKGGSGATEGYDGWNHTGPVSNMGGSRATDPEIFELAYPYQLLQYELAPNTGGAGKWRGGLGAVLRWRVDSAEVQCVTVGSGMLEETRAFGLFGAHPGSLPTMQMTSRDGASKSSASIAFMMWRATMCSNSIPKAAAASAIPSSARRSRCSRMSSLATSPLKAHGWITASRWMPAMANRE